MLAGRPNDPSYVEAGDRAAEAIIREGQTANFPSKEKKHRRGPFPAKQRGVQYGKGQPQPTDLKNGPYDAMLERLTDDPDIARHATYQSSAPLTLSSLLLMQIFTVAAFKLWAPKVYSYYKSHLDAMYDKLPHLKFTRNFPKSIYPCITYNFGGNVWTYKHRDVLNCPFGWCVIQALGNFNPTKGGHLILWDLKLVVQFPPNSTILIPSATMAHSNIPVQEGDSRVSFTQYCAGRIFRWVDKGFRTEKEFEEADKDRYDAVMARKAARWEMGLSLLSTIDELLLKIA